MWTLEKLVLILNYDPKEQFMRIKKLELFSSNIEAQTKFYTEILELKVLTETDNSVSFQIGESILEFTNKANSTPYHFAFNIPVNKESEALEWLKGRTDILKVATKEVQEIEDWNAKAIYFYDPDKNIVEFIIRYNLENASDQTFKANQRLELSEIGIPVSDIESVFYKLHDTTGIEIYDGNFERFCAIGDEHGLFICLNKNVKDWFPTNDKAFSSEFNLRFEEAGNTFDLEFSNEKLNLVQV